MPEIFQRSQLWMNRLVTALFGADGPGAADIIGLRGDGIVFPLSECVSDRMDWRKINHIESHVRDIRKPGFAISKCSLPPRIGRTRPGKHFVPGREARLL